MFLLLGSGPQVFGLLADRSSLQNQTHLDIESLKTMDASDDGYSAHQTLILHECPEEDISGEPSEQTVGQYLAARREECPEEDISGEPSEQTVGQYLAARREKAKPYKEVRPMIPAAEPLNADMDVRQYSMMLWLVAIAKGEKATTPS
ncbi:unnamed protein product [Oppiella nova]|uniref:Uncharacterized protein n=1 Tax=Oppiella nova TaxID=334625 RepID=A0A7R9M9D3_9ACAR|nr:unnamed protein product [Oppiella nova]CAG2173050.1 unnamed protein product [Oppiella nova]